MRPIIMSRFFCALIFTLFSINSVGLNASLPEKRISWRISAVTTHFTTPVAGELLTLITPHPAPTVSKLTGWTPSLQAEVRHHFSSSFYGSLSASYSFPKTFRQQFLDASSHVLDTLQTNTITTIPVSISMGYRLGISPHLDVNLFAGPDCIILFDSFYRRSSLIRDDHFQTLASHHGPLHQVAFGTHLGLEIEYKRFSLGVMARFFTMNRHGDVDSSSLFPIVSNSTPSPWPYRSVNETKKAEDYWGLDDIKTTTLSIYMSIRI
jgi:hypothetical protein